MAQATDYSLADQSGAAFRAELNTILAAVASLNSGTSAPSTTYANMLWVDTTNGRLKKRNNANTTWIDLGPMDSFFDDAMPVSSKSAGYTAVAGDRGKLIDFTADATLGYTAAATLGAGWWCAVRVSGAGKTVTHDPNSAEQIDGQGTIVQGQGEGFLVVCDGSGFKTIGRGGGDNPWTDIASAATTDLGSIASRHLRITGTTGISSFGPAPAGTRRTGRFASALTLTHNATSLILPGAANITTAADDRFDAVSLGSSNWIVTGYTRADGTPLVSSASGRLLAVQFLKSGTSYTRAAGCTHALVVARGGGGGGGGVAPDGSNTGGFGGGGGQGGLCIKWIAPAATETYAIGAGGSAASGASGGAGGNTTFGSHVTAGGGGGGGVGVNSSSHGASGAGGSASSGDLNITGTQNPSETLGYGGGGAGEGAGASRTSSGAGNAATANTGGGGGGGVDNSTIQRAGGAGGSGYIIVYEYS